MLQGNWVNGVICRGFARKKLKNVTGHFSLRIRRNFAPPKLFDSMLTLKSGLRNGDRRKLMSVAESQF